MKYLLVLIYSGLIFSADPRDDLVQCTQEAASRIGEERQVKIWDSMNGSNPIPRVVIAFCVEGSATKEAK